MSSITGPAGVHSKGPEASFSVQLQEATVPLMLQVYLAPQRSRPKSQPVVVYTTVKAPVLAGGKVHPRAEKISHLNKKMTLQIVIPQLTIPFCSPY